MNPTMPRILILISLFTVGIYAQTPTPTPSPSMRTILEGKIKESFAQCGGWPPKLVKQEKRLDKKVPSDAPEVSNELINLIIKESDFTDLSERPTLYTASHLRLLDSIGFDTNNANALISDTELFGLAASASRDEIQAWGTSHALVKLDCMSMLNLAANAKPGSGLVIPLISLEAAFSASRNADRKDQIVIYYSAHLNSPFDKALDSSDPARRRFALMRALSWRLKHPSNANAKYISKGAFLVLDNHSNSNQNSSILGNLKAGLNIPFVNLNGAADGKLAKTMTAEMSSYSTYYWKTSLVDLPTTNDLVASISATMTIPFQFDRNEIKPQQPITATAEIDGWDSRLCAPIWKPDAANVNFGVIDVTAKVKPTPAPSDTTSAPFAAPATCILTTKFFLKASPANNEIIGSPQLSVKLKDNDAVSFALNTPDRLFLLGKPTVNMVLMNSTWDKKTVEGTDFVKWNLVGRVDPPRPQAGQQRKIISVQTRNENLVCDNGKETVQLNALNQTSAINEPRFLADALLLIDSGGGNKYDSSTEQPTIMKRRCTIKGELLVTTSLPDGTAQEQDTVGFSTINEVDFPGRVSAPPPPTGLALGNVDGRVRLSWEKAYSAETYTVYRSTSVEEEGEPVSGANLKLTSFDDQLPAATATAIIYYYKVKANNPKGSSKATSFEPFKWVKPNQ